MATFVSNARAFFDHITDQSDPYAYLSSIPDPAAAHFPFFEEEWLDFKGAPRNEDDAKKIWSKALSGYANITDGLIIWGIDARKMQPRGLDAASGLNLLPDPAAMESQLRDWIRDATNPPVMGVEYAAYTDSGGEGFLVCLIPESRHKPHRAEFAKRHYYYRAGDDFLMAEPGLLRTLFYPRIRARIVALASVNFLLTGRRRGKIEITLACTLTIMNSGNGSAKDVSIVIDSNMEGAPEEYAGVGWKFVGSWFHGDAFHPNQYSAHPIAYVSEHPLHPGLPSLVSILKWKTQMDPEEGMLDDPKFADRFDLTLTVYGDGVQGDKLTVGFDADDLKIKDEAVMKRFELVEEGEIRD